MRLLITGGFGFIGSSFVRMAYKSGHDLSIVDKMTYAADLRNIPKKILDESTVAHFDLSDTRLLAAFMREQESFDFIVNFAAESHVDRSINDGLPFVHSNILPVVNLLEYLKSQPNTKLLQVSTDEVYGSVESGSADEYFPLQPRSAYASSKASAEFFCDAYRITHGIGVYISRCANNFGPRQSVEKLIPTVIASAIHNKMVPVYGSGMNVREWIHVDNHSEALLKLIESKSPRHNHYNLGGTESTNVDLVVSILEIMGKPGSLIKYVEDRKGHDMRYSVDDSRFVGEFGKIRDTDFQKRLEHTVNWYLDNPDWLVRSADRLNK